MGKLSDRPVGPGALCPAWVARDGSTAPQLDFSYLKPFCGRHTGSLPLSDSGPAQ